jgi:cytochrome P450
MPDERVRVNIRLTIAGGQNESRDAIAGAVWALRTHSDQLALVRAGEVTLLPDFEEYCRWIAPIGMSPRRISERHTFGGTTFEPDERVFLMFGSANRDDDHFVDAAVSTSPATPRPP